MSLINLSQERDKWQAGVNTEMKFHKIWEISQVDKELSASQEGFLLRGVGHSASFGIN
jgi:hypothetical protein